MIDVGAGGTAVAPAGWQLQSGTLVGEGEESATSVAVVLVRGGATIELRGASFTGTATQFLTQVQRSRGEAAGQVSGTRGTVVTASGLVGVAQTRSGPAGDRLDVAFKMATGPAAAINGAPALLVRVVTGPGQFEQYRGTVAAMLSTVTAGPRS